MFDSYFGFRGIVSIGLIVFIVWLISEKKSRFPFSLVVAGILIQFTIALLFLKLEPVASVFHAFAVGLNELFSHADAGIHFLFGDKLGSTDGPVGFVFAIRVLPLIIFFSSLVAVLYHYGVMQIIILSIAWFF